MLLDPCSRRILTLAIATALLIAHPSPRATAAEDLAAGLHLRSDQMDAPAVVGDQGWWYFGTELEAYRNPAAHDREGGPLAGIVHYHELLAEWGIEFVVVPVPGKIASHLGPLLGDGDWPSAAIDALFAAVRADGVTVLDLRGPLAALRDADIATHCCQDSRWSPRGLETPADHIPDRLTAAE